MDMPMPTATPEYRLFLRAIAEEIEHMAGPGERDDMLRAVGTRMARLAPLPQVQTLDALEMEINDQLAQLGWGQAQLDLQPAERVLVITHEGMPRIGSLGSPPGTWLSALLEGLYETWIGAQPGAVPSLTARRSPVVSGTSVVLRFGRA